MCLWGIKCVFMGNEMIKMCVYGEVSRSSLITLLFPMRKLRGSVFKMCVYGD